jgi:hypothetical protein
VLEIWEATIILKRWYRLKRGKEVATPDEKSWAIPATYLGLVLVIAGVVGEGVFEALVSNADTALRAHDSQVLAQAVEEAGDAATSAHNAHSEADTVSQEATGIEMRLNRASSQLSGIEKAVKAQEPRWWILDSEKDRFIAALKPYAGQRIIIDFCGGASPEQDLTSARLRTLLEEEYSGWKVVNHLWPQCLAAGNGGDMGSETDTSSAADNGTLRAAKALSDTLNRMGINNVNFANAPPSFVAIDPFLFGPDAPDGLAVRNPASVVLFVGANPALDLEEWNKMHPRKRQTKTRNQGTAP